MFDFIKYNVDFDQLIWEYGNKTEPDWVHVSQNDKGKNRGQVLRVYRIKGVPKYIVFDLYLLPCKQINYLLHINTLASCASISNY